MSISIVKKISGKSLKDGLVSFDSVSDREIKRHSLKIYNLSSIFEINKK